MFPIRLEGRRCELIRCSAESPGSRSVWQVSRFSPQQFAPQRCRPASPRASSPAGCAVRPRCSSPPMAVFSSASRPAHCASSRTERLLSAPFLTLSVNSSGERGLLGVAFDPDFISNQFVYVYYTTASTPIHNRISRFTANGDVAVPGSEVVLLEPQQFERRDESQRRRAGVRAATGSCMPLSAKTPTARTRRRSTTCSERCSGSTRTARSRATTRSSLRRPATTGRSGRWASAIRSHSRSTRSARRCSSTTSARTRGRRSTRDAPAPTTGGRRPRDHVGPGIDGPRHAYSHSNPAGSCAITGGAFYHRTAPFPSQYFGDYFFADYCGGWIRRLDLATDTVALFAEGISFPVDLKVSDDGSLYYLARGTGSATGTVVRVQFGASPSISSHPASRTVAPGASVTFSVTCVGSTSAAVSVAAERGQHRRRDGAELHDRLGVDRRTTGPGSGSSSATTSGASPATRRC